MSATAHTTAVHCSESVDTFAAQHELDPSAVAILLRLWMESRDPYAVGPVVTMSAPALARAVRLSENRARLHLAKLRSCGAVEAVGNGGAVRRYRLRRPAAHEAANAAAAEAAAARAAKREADKGKPVKADDLRSRQPEGLPVTKALTYYRCGTCYRCFATEQGIRAHQDLWGRLHRIDPEIDEHDGQPWQRVTVQPGEHLAYEGRSCTLVEAVDRETRECDFILSRNHVQWRGDVFSIYVPRIDEQLVRAWAAATQLGDLTEDEALEVDVREYSNWLSYRWHDEPNRLAEERHTMLAMIGVVQIAVVQQARQR